VGSLKEVQDGGGDRYYREGQRLYIKLTDEGDASVDPDFFQAGAAVFGMRYFNMLCAAVVAGRPGACCCWGAGPLLHEGWAAVLAACSCLPCRLQLPPAANAPC
jgi:hypothetical protein